MADRAALLIAVETFFEAGPPVAYAAADLAEVARTLPAIGYTAERCLLLAGHRTTRASIESHLARLPKLIGKPDSLLVVVVSRGFSHNGRGYLACADTITPDLTGTSLAVADLLAALHRTRCRDIALLLDIDTLASPGENLTPGLAQDELTTLIEASPSCVALLASEPGERSFESAQLKHGIWRSHLLEILSGKVRTGIARDGTLTALTLHQHLADAVPRTLRRAYETREEQTPLLFGEEKATMVIGNLGSLLGPAGDLLDPARMKRVVFRSETIGKVKELAGYRKSHSLPDRANDWARKYVHRIAHADIKTDLDQLFEAIRDQFGYKRKDLDVSAERDGLGFIRTPDFEYTITIEVNADDPTEVVWRREVGRLSDPALVRSEAFAAVFGAIMNRLVFEFAIPVDVADFVDRIEETPLEGVKVTVDSDSDAAEVRLAGMPGRISVTRESVEIEGRAGSSSGLLDQFLAFLQKFAGVGEPKQLGSHSPNAE